MYELFGSGKDLNALQMSCRAVVAFLVALPLLRVSGRRSFGMHAPFDNIISILLGAVLSRAVVGASPFVPVIVACVVIVVLHRGLGWLNMHSKSFSELVQGKKITLFEEQQFLEKNMNKALVSKHDLEQAVRHTASTENLAKVRKMIMEANGEISIIKAED